MFDQLNVQLKESMKPVTELASLNMSALQDIAEKQNALFSTLLNNGMSFVETASQQKDVMSLAETQKAYVEGLQETVTDAAKETYEVITTAQKQATDLIKASSEEFSSKVTAAAK
jgi:phasin family protein